MVEYTGCLKWGVLELRNRVLMIVGIVLPACEVTFTFSTEITILLCQHQLLPNNVQHSKQHGG